MQPIKGTVTDPAATQALFNRDPGDETDAYEDDRILLDRGEYNRRMQLSFESGYVAGHASAEHNLKLKLMPVARALNATLGS